MIKDPVNVMPLLVNDNIFKHSREVSDVLVKLCNIDIDDNDEQVIELILDQLYNIIELEDIEFLLTDTNDLLLQIMRHVGVCGDLVSPFNNVMVIYRNMTKLYELCLSRKYIDKSTNSIETVCKKEIVISNNVQFDMTYEYMSNLSTFGNNGFIFINSETINTTKLCNDLNNADFDNKLLKRFMLKLYIDKLELENKMYINEGTTLDIRPIVNNYLNALT